MSFEVTEASRKDASPVTLYLFRYGDDANAIFAYTDAEFPIVRDGVTYTPVPIQRDSIQSSGTLDKAKLEVKLPNITELVGLFLIYPPSYVVTLTIFQGNLPEEDFRAVWSGRIVAVSREGVESKLMGEPISTAMRRPGLRRNYQYGCPLVLYGPNCRAAKGRATVSALVTSTTSTRIELSSGWTYPSLVPKFVGGMVEWRTALNIRQVRSILSVLGDNQLRLGGDTNGLSSGMTVSVTLGCDHTMNDCRGIHNNILNFGGQPWIPTNNPIGFSSLYY